MEYQSYKSIPNSLRQYRKDRGLSQKEVAAFLRLKDNTLISRWERGDSLPNLVSVIHLSILYEIPVNELFPDLVTDILQEAKKLRGDVS